MIRSFCSADQVRRRSTVEIISDDMCLTVLKHVNKDSMIHQNPPRSARRQCRSPERTLPLNRRVPRSSSETRAGQSRIARYPRTCDRGPAPPLLCGRCRNWGEQKFHTERQQKLAHVRLRTLDQNPKTPRVHEVALRDQEMYVQKHTLSDACPQRKLAWAFKKSKRNGVEPAIAPGSTCITDLRGRPALGRVGHLAA